MGSRTEKGEGQMASTPGSGSCYGPTWPPTRRPQRKLQPRYALLPAPRNPKPAFLWENGSWDITPPPCALNPIGLPVSRTLAQRGWLPMGNRDAVDRLDDASRFGEGGSKTGAKPVAG